MSNEIHQDTRDNTSVMSDEIWHDASDEIQQNTSHDASDMTDEIQQTSTCEICIEPSMLSEKFGHDANCVHNICFMVRCIITFSTFFLFVCFQSIKPYT